MGYGNVVRRVNLTFAGGGVDVAGVEYDSGVEVVAMLKHWTIEANAQRHRKSYIVIHGCLTAPRDKSVYMP